MMSYHLTSSCPAQFFGVSRLASSNLTVRCGTWMSPWPIENPPTPETMNHHRTMVRCGQSLLFTMVSKVVFSSWGQGLLWIIHYLDAFPMRTRPILCQVEHLIGEQLPDRRRSRMRVGRRGQQKFIPAELVTLENSNDLQCHCRLWMFI